MLAARVLVYKQLEECKLMQGKARRIRRDEENGLCRPNPVCPVRHKKHPQRHKLFNAGKRKSRSHWFCEEADEIIKAMAPGILFLAMPPCLSGGVWF